MTRAQMASLTCCLAFGGQVGCQGVPGTLERLDAASSDEPIDASVFEAPDPVWPADEPLPPEFDFPPFVTMPAPNRFVVGFRTAEIGAARVRFGVTDQYGTTIAADSEDGQFFSADLGELPPATAIYYEVEIDGTGARRRGAFLTSGRSSWRFIHIAEFHAISESDNVALFADEVRQFRPHVIIESGDMLDNGDSLAGWRSYFQTSAPWISNAIILPVGSNHVTGADGNGFIRFFFSLPNNERWYSTRFSQTEIFSLDSTYGAARPEIEQVEPVWLAGQLASIDELAADGPRFVIGAWHYPACSTHQKTRAVYREWVMDHFVDTFIDSSPGPDAGVDLILTGHDKYYERSLIDGVIPHLTTNTGKLAPSTEGDNHVRCTPIVTNIETRSLVLGSVNDESMKLEAIDSDGEVLDSFSIAPRQR